MCVGGRQKNRARKRGDREKQKAERSDKFEANIQKERMVKSFISDVGEESIVAYAIFFDDIIIVNTLTPSINL